MPATADFDAAAAIPLAGLTALQALRDELQLRPGSHVFIPGGAGGVGTFAIQLAKWLGAHVTTTASPRGCELVEQLGADTVIDYTAERIADHARDVDGVLDLVGGDTLDQSFALVKPGGKVVSVVATPEPEKRAKTSVAVQRSRRCSGSSVSPCGRRRKSTVRAIASCSCTRAAPSCPN